MDTRAQTLDAIQQYITTQRALLSRTQSDIDRLLKLRREAIEKPAEFLSGQTYAHSFHLTDLSECAPTLPENIDWSLYASLDPTALRTLTHNTHIAHSHNHPKAPHKTQRSPLSPLQRLVKEARVTILEPVLGVGLGHGSGISTPGGATSSDIGIGEPGGDGDEYDCIRGGKKKKGGLTVVAAQLQSHQLRVRGSNGAFMPTPTSTSSTSTPNPDTSGASQSRLRRHSRASTVDLNTPATSISLPFQSPTPPPFPLPLSQTKSARTRRPSTKFSKDEFDNSTPSRRRRPAAVLKDGEVKSLTSTSSAVAAMETVSIKLGKRVRRASSPPSVQPVQPHRARNETVTKSKSKIKPETYKQAWSISEQHLLEKLLDEIPEGEKNRWQKISQAMQGRRTPRQVASRVQKYFEKLKRFGVGVGPEE